MLPTEEDLSKELEPSIQGEWKQRNENIDPTVLILTRRCSRMNSERTVSSVGTMMSENLDSGEMMNSGRSDIQFFQATFDNSNQIIIMHLNENACILIT